MSLRCWVEVRTADDMSWWATTGVAKADVVEEVSVLVAKAARVDPRQGVAVTIRVPHV